MEDNPYTHLTPDEVELLIAGVFSDLTEEVTRGWPGGNPVKLSEHVAILMSRMESKLTRLNQLVRQWMKYEAERVRLGGD